MSCSGQDLIFVYKPGFELYCGEKRGRYDGGNPYLPTPLPSAQNFELRLIIQLKNVYLMMHIKKYVWIKYLSIYIYLFPKIEIKFGSKYLALETSNPFHRDQHKTFSVYCKIEIER